MYYNALHKPNGTFYEPQSYLLETRFLETCEEACRALLGRYVVYIAVKRHGSSILSTSHFKPYGMMSFADEAKHHTPTWYHTRTFGSGEHTKLKTYFGPMHSEPHAGAPHDFPLEYSSSRAYRLARSTGGVRRFWEVAK